MILQKIDSLSDLFSRYRLLVCDIWGVLHNGVAVYEKAIQALRDFREGGGKVVLLTNAPKPIHIIEERFARLGVPDRFWDHLVTSGSMVTRYLNTIARPVSVFHWGSEDDKGIYDGTEAIETDLKEAELIVCTSLLDSDHEITHAEMVQLESPIRRQVPFLCANPDRAVKIGNESMICAGALAELYAKMGGKVFWFGKPYPDVYQESMTLTGHTDKSTILAIGDGLYTDIAGANKFGIDSVLIQEGLHKSLFEKENTIDKIKTICDTYHAHPTYYMSLMR